MSEDQSGREGLPCQWEDPAPSFDSGARLRAMPVTHQEFRTGFDRYFRRVYAYVSRRVSDRGACERIVREVLTANVALLLEQTDERRSLSSIKAFSDRLIELEGARNASAEILTNARGGNSGPGGLPATERGIDDDQRKV